MIDAKENMKSEENKMKIVLLIILGLSIVNAIVGIAKLCFLTRK